ncbi:hypothetical protein B0H67DRAFT_578266 [Lasiosphaeris hirsuta]|uniref:Secreted protein n=1 Tax=Lasiosphaeris hirsuta TaxID=260670 RepID=A0AA40ASG7_9PEZI|nr:hypothetical protein B0H67DRAFT_578266 [Lasiosphaeris hirsuta]
MWRVWCGSFKGSVLPFLILMRTRLIGVCRGILGPSKNLSAGVGSGVDGIEDTQSGIIICTRGIVFALGMTRHQMGHAYLPSKS